MKLIEKISHIMGYINMVVVVVMMLLISADVVLRYLFSSPISGVKELTEFMMVIVLFGAAWCAFEGMHVKIDIIASHFSPKLQAWSEIVTLFLSLVVFAVAAWQGVSAMQYSLEYGVKSTILGIPEAVTLGIFSLGFAMLCLSIICIFIKRTKEVFGK